MWLFGVQGVMKFLFLPISLRVMLGFCMGLVLVCHLFVCILQSFTSLVVQTLLLFIPIPHFLHLNCLLLLHFHDWSQQLRVTSFNFPFPLFLQIPLFLQCHILQLLYTRFYSVFQFFPSLFKPGYLFAWSSVISGTAASDIPCLHYCPTHMWQSETIWYIKGSNLRHHALLVLVL